MRSLFPTCTPVVTCSVDDVLVQLVDDVSRAIAVALDGVHVSEQHDGRLVLEKNSMRSHPRRV